MKKKNVGDKRMSSSRDAGIEGERKERIGGPRWMNDDHDRRTVAVRVTVEAPLFITTLHQQFTH